MTRLVRFLLAASALGATLTSAGPATATDSPTASPRTAPTAEDRARVRDLLTARRASFLEEGGRLGGRADFTVESDDRTFFFGRDAVTVALVDSHRDSDPARPGRSVLRLAFDGANPAARAEGADARPWTTNVLKGAATSWRTGLRAFGEITYRDLWPGIDLVWTGDRGATGDGGMKWEARVAPGADPRAVRIRIDGADSATIADDGRLVITTARGTLEDSAPVAWQETPSGRRAVPVAWALRDSVLSFDVGAHDASLPLILDPATIVRTGFLGGAADDGADAITVDQAGTLFLAGSTKSLESSFPASTGFDATFNRGPQDAFACAITSTFVLGWCTYLGGGGDDAASGIAVDNFASAVVVGRTTSTDFPVTGALGAQPPGGNYDIFVARLRNDGRALTFCGIAGGAGDDRAAAVVPGTFNTYIVAGKSAGGLPFQAPVPGGGDGFVMAVRADGTAVNWGRYLGGSGPDEITGLAADAAGAVWVCGNTSSTNFPTLTGPLLTAGGGGDAFVAKIDSLTTSTLWAGYIGGSNADEANGLAVDSQGRAIVVGSTLSAETAGFPVVAGPDLTYNGKRDGYIARVAADGTAFDVCGYIGGSGDDFAQAVTVDASRRPIVVGFCGSTEIAYPKDRAGFPVFDGPDDTFQGGVRDGFAGILPESCAQWLALGYVGGKGNVDECRAVVRRTNGEVYVAGLTMSPPKTFSAGSGPAIVASGGRDAFLTQIQFLVTVTPQLVRPTLDSVTVNGRDVVVLLTDNDVNETSYEVQRTDLTGRLASFTVATAPAQSGGQIQITDSSADPGTRYAYRARALTSSAASPWTEPVSAFTSGGFDLKMKSAKFAKAGSPGEGTLSAKLAYKAQPTVPGVAFDPVTDGITFLIQGTGAGLGASPPDDITFAIPPLDPLWVPSGPRATWTGVLGATTELTVVIDTQRRLVTLTARGLTFEVPATAKPPIRIAFTSGAHYASETFDFRFAKTTYRAP